MGLLNHVGITVGNLQRSIAFYTSLGFGEPPADWVFTIQGDWLSALVAEKDAVIDVAFLTMDAGEAKTALIERLHARGITFIDIGMGLEPGDKGLSGILRVTASTPAARGSAGRIPLAGGGANDLYASNIQVADLNALNAVLAVIKWKKLSGFYCDLEREHHSTYTLDGNMLLNEDAA